MHLRQIVLRFMTLNSSAMLIKILLLHPIIMYLTNIYQILAMIGFFSPFPSKAIGTIYQGNIRQKGIPSSFLFSWIDLLITQF